MAVLNFDIKSITLPSGEEGKAVFLTGSIDASTNQAFEKRLTDILSSGTKHVLLVLTNVKYINSTGLGTIVKCVDTFREKSGDIKLVGVPTKVIALFEMLGLLALFETYETIDAAVASYTKKKKDEKAAAAPTVKFPIQFRHPVTGMGLNVSQPGRFKDPRSGDYFSVDASGTIEFYEMGKVRMSEVKLPAQFDLAAALAPLASGLCQACGLPNALSSNLQAALARVSSAIQAKATDSSEMCQVILVADPEKLQVGIVNYGNGLNLRGDDPVLRELSKMVSEAKHQPLPTRGHLLTLVVRK
ncbi:MAG: STAS domain-containing protein [Planctomycetota bacterium]|nr:STAS domain-containing protein [Planctomycetota bacterium]MDW8372312.1 STAS domain-containing protein [Planctomycetota bacterium]